METGKEVWLQWDECQGGYLEEENVKIEIRD